MRICRKKSEIKSGHLEIDREGITLENLKRLNSLGKDSVKRQTLSIKIETIHRIRKIM